VAAPKEEPPMAELTVAIFVIAIAAVLLLVARGLERL
jgi:hypothetical protein